jgi:hypothetical protein
LRISQLGGALAAQSFDRFVQLVDFLAQHGGRGRDIQLRLQTIDALAEFPGGRRRSVCATSDKSQRRSLFAASIFVAIAAAGWSSPSALRRAIA